MALLTFGHQGRRDPERSGKTHLDGRQVVSTSFAKVFLNTLILGQNWSLGGGVWPTSSKWLRRRGGARQVQKSVEGVENTILTPGFQSGYISGGLWSSAWKAREPKDSKNLQGFKFETKQKYLTDVFFFKSQVEFCSPQKIVGGGGEKSGSLTRSKIAAGRTLPDYSWSAIWLFWRSSVAVIYTYSLVQIFRPILILEPQTLLITLPDYSWSALWPIAVSSYISGTGAESC